MSTPNDDLYVANTDPKSRINTDIRILTGSYAFSLTVTCSVLSTSQSRERFTDTPSVCPVAPPREASTVYVPSRSAGPEYVQFDAVPSAVNVAEKSPSVTVTLASALYVTGGAVMLVVVGVASYSLYLVHWPVMLVLTPDRTGLDVLRCRLGYRQSRRTTQRHQDQGFVP